MQRPLLAALLYPAAWAPAVVTHQFVADGGVTDVAVAMIPVTVTGRAEGSDVV